MRGIREDLDEMLWAGGDRSARRRRSEGEIKKHVVEGWEGASDDDDDRGCMGWLDRWMPGGLGLDGLFLLFGMRRSWEETSQN